MLTPVNGPDALATMAQVRAAMAAQVHAAMAARGLGRPAGAAACVGGAPAHHYIYVCALCFIVFCTYTVEAVCASRSGETLYGWCKTTETISFSADEEVIKRPTVACETCDKACRILLSFRLRELRLEEAQSGRAAAPGPVQSELHAYGGELLDAAACCFREEGCASAVHPGFTDARARAELHARLPCSKVLPNLEIKRWRRQRQAVFLATPTHPGSTSSATAMSSRSSLLHLSPTIFWAATSSESRGSATVPSGSCRMVSPPLPFNYSP
eukprot:1552640-Pleurochrysis_carterae.AAC.8